MKEKLAQSTPPVGAALSTSLNSGDDATLLAARLSGVNKAWFGRQAGISPTMIAHHLAGRRAISLSDAVKYARAFGVPLDEISLAHAELVVTAYPLTRHHKKTNRVSQTLAAAPLAFS